MLKNNIYTSVVSITDELGNIVGDITGKDGVVKIRNLDLGPQLSASSSGSTGESGDRYNTLSQSVLISPVLGGSLTFIVDINLSYLQGNSISVINTGNINNNFKGSVLSYTKSTGVLVCGNIREINGTFTQSSVYNINIHFSNFADNLITNTLMSMPPAPTVIDLTTYSTSTEVGFAIQNPARVPFGNILIPYIDNIKITLGSNNDVTILDNNINIPSTDLDIRAIVLSKIGASGRVNKIFNQQSIPAYVYTNPDISDHLEEGKYKVNIWFNNTLINGTPNVLTVTLADFMTSFPPSTPLNLSIDFLTQKTASLSWTLPTYNSGDIDDPNVSISDYKIEYINTNTPSRHPSGGYTIGTSSLVTSTSLNKTLSSLLPGTNYTAIISARNNVNPNYGATGAIAFLTLNPVAPPTISNLPLTLPSSFLYASVKRVSDGSVISVPIYLSTVNAGNLPILTNLPIHSASKIGSIETGLMTLDSYLDDVLNQTVSFNGFTTPEYTSSVAINGFIFESINIGDYYTNQDETNFYKICSSIRPVLTQTNVPLTKGEPHTIKIEFLRLGGETVTSNSLIFYLDDLTKSPSVSTLNIIDSFVPKTVTGIPIVGSSEPQNVTYTTSIMNFARYFYRSDKIYSLSSTDPGVNVTLNSITSLGSMTSPIDSDTDYPLSGSTTVSFVNGNNSLGINLTGTVYSPYTSTGSSSSRTFMIPKILDTLTYNKLDISPTVKLSTTGFISGYRVKTQESISLLSSQNSSSFASTVFDNNMNLLTSPYTNELPIIKGYYKTRANEAVYLSSIKDYGGPDYTQMASEDGFRYSTFSWNVDMEEVTTINKLEFKFINFNANGLVTRDNSSSSIVSNGDKFVVYYRFVELDGSGNPILPQDDSDTPTVLTSYWLNANQYGSYFKGFYNKSINNGSLGGLIFSDEDVSPINNPSSQSFTYNVLTHSFLPKTSGKSGLRIYMMIGIKMDANITFSDIMCKYWNPP